MTSYTGDHDPEQILPSWDKVSRGFAQLTLT